MADKRDWNHIAEEASREIDAAPLGGREAALEANAGRWKIKPPTLRTYLLASRFLKSLPADVADAAKAMPAIALETAARWHAYDPVGALSAMKTFHSIRSLARAEFAARRAKGSESITQKMRRYGETIKDQLHLLTDLWPDRPPCPIRECRASEMHDRSGKADFMVEHWERRSSDAMAVVVVGPYSVASAYDGRAADWCLRALGLTYFHDHVALLLPRGARAEAFVEFLARTPEAHKHVQLVEEREDATDAGGGQRGGIRRRTTNEPVRRGRG
jgi:hypothetical protein